MSERKQISKKLRFEVFKRDNFSCQYCGKKSPDVILEVDHINPVYEGGTNDILNLITACFDCNRGKSKNKLDDNSVIQKQRGSLEELNEKRNQMKMMLDWKRELSSIDNEAVEEVSDFFSELTGYTFSDSFKSKKAKTYIKKYGLLEVLESIEIAFTTYCENGTKEDAEKMLDKLGGILYNRNLKEKNPEAFEKNMAKSYVRKSYSYINEGELDRLVSLLFLSGYNQECIVQFAKASRSWTQFRCSIEELLENN